MTMDARIRPTIHHVIGRDGRFVLASHDGDVRVRGIDGDAVQVRAGDGEGLGHLAVERGDRTLTLRSGSGAERGPGHRGISDLVIEVPSGAEVVIEGDSMDMDADGLTGVQRYRTGSGDLRLRDVRGSISAEVISGDLDIVAGGTVQLDIRAVSGDVAVRAASIATFRATTTSGDLRVAGRFDGDGPYAIETVSGDVAIASTGPVRVDLRTLTGDIRSDVPAKTEDGPGRRSVVIGAGGPTIDIRSTSGDVRIVAAREIASPVAAPAPPAIQTPSSAFPPTTAPAQEDESTTDDQRRLDVLRALERGEVEIDEARRQLEALDHD
jgi:hypothetical protein